MHFAGAHEFYSFLPPMSSTITRVDSPPETSGSRAPRKFARLRCEDSLDRMGLFYAGQAEVEALVIDAEAFVVETELLENGGVDIADVHWVLEDVVAEVISDTMRDAALDAASRHPHSETLRMVIAAIVGSREFALAVDGAAEFAAPNDQGIVE